MKISTDIHPISVILLAFATLFLMSITLENKACGGTVSSREPQGLKLGDGRLIRWGETTEVARSGLTDLKCLGGGEDLPGPVEDDCYANRDLNLPEPFSNAHLSFSNHKFYQVHLRTGSENFETVESELTSALAQKPHQQKSILQNGFGARFDQTIDSWMVNHVVLLLERQDPETLGATDLMIRYDPLMTPQGEMEGKQYSVPF
jgi:hypothetical protein